MALFELCVGVSSAAETNFIITASDNPGDAAWLTLEQACETPAERLPQLPGRMYTQDEIRAYYGRLAVRSAALADQADRFAKQFPTNRHAAEARDLNFKLLQSAVAQGSTNRVADLEKATAERIQNTPEETNKFELAQQLLHCAVSGRQYESDDAMRAELHKRARQLALNFPNRPEGVNYLFNLAENAPSNQCVVIAREAMTLSPDTNFQATCRGLIYRTAAVGKPLALKLALTNGAALNLEAERGKVLVLLFWDSSSRFSAKAIWAVDQLYQKYKGKGLAVVGLNFDTDRAKARSLLADAKVEWPQYFDCLTGGMIQKQFGLRTLPACWIVDKKGVLRDLKVERNPKGLTEQLLAEP